MKKKTKTRTSSTASVAVPTVSQGHTNAPAAFQNRWSNNEKAEHPRSNQSILIFCRDDDRPIGA
jgi:hypothetical protein